MSNLSPVIDYPEEEDMDDIKWSQLNPAWKDENEAEEHAVDHSASVTSPASKEASYQAPVTRSNFHNNFHKKASLHHSTLIDRPFFCQRCFLRRQYHQGHVCETAHGHKACQWCAHVHQRCIPVPGQFDELVQAALQLTDVAQSRAIADIRRQISMRTRLLNRALAAKTKSDHCQDSGLV